MSLAVISQADILVSLSRLQLLYSPARTVWETENGVVVANPVYVDVDVDLAVAARDKSAGSLALLVSDVPTHWVRTCSMSSIGRVDCDDVDDILSQENFTIVPVKEHHHSDLASKYPFWKVLGPFWGLVWAPQNIFLPKWTPPSLLALKSTILGQFSPLWGFGNSIFWDWAPK